MRERRGGSYRGLSSPVGDSGFSSGGGRGGRRARREFGLRCAGTPLFHFNHCLIHKLLFIMPLVAVCFSDGLSNGNVILPVSLSTNRWNLCLCTLKLQLQLHFHFQILRSGCGTGIIPLFIFTPLLAGPLFWLAPSAVYRLTLWLAPYATVALRISAIFSSIIKFLYFIQIPDKGSKKTV